jgi:uncharacterized membrane protein (DUF485 family)
VFPNLKICVALAKPVRRLQFLRLTIILQRLQTAHRNQGIPMQSYNARLGLGLFMLYLVFYGSFVLLSAFKPDLMEQRPFAGVNLAILYGFALIFGAFGLALLYGLLCKPESPDEPEPPGKSRLL